jgi:hypothetical protein
VTQALHDSFGASRTSPIPFRILSGVGVLVAVWIFTIFTLAVTLVATIGLTGARYLARRRRRALTLGGSWLGAAMASTLAIMLMFGGLLLMAPPEAIDEMREAMNSAQDQPPPKLPAWLERISPSSAREPGPITKRVVNSSAFTIYFGLLGLVLACVLLGAAAGTFGWIIALLTGHAFSGRWIGRPAAATGVAGGEITSPPSAPY